LLESAAQTIVGAIGSYAFSSIIAKVYERNTFEGAYRYAGDRTRMAGRPVIYHRWYVFLLHLL